MRPWIAVFWSLVFSSSVACSGYKTDVSTGLSYNVNVLKKSENEGYYVSGEDYDYRINICDRIIPQTNETFKGNDVMCYQWSKLDSNKSYICARATEEISIKQGSVLLSYSNGEECISSEGKQRNKRLDIILTCAQKDSKSDFKHPVFISDDNYTTTLFWSTYAACPTTTVAPKPTNSPSDKSGTSWFKFLFFLLVLCFILGFFYRSLVLEKSGWDRVPGFGLIKPTQDFLINKKHTLFSGYQHLPTNEDQFMQDEYYSAI